jgi:uncharacterized membrane protein YecN with MAPEG domain
MLGAEERAMQVTMLTAAILALLLVVLSVRVTAVRRSQQVSIGDGGDAALALRIRAQANCAEYVPIALILLFLAEQAQGASLLVVAMAVLLVAGRIAHPIGMALPAPNIWRVFGMIGTWTPIIILSVVLLWTAGARLLA